MFEKASRLKVRYDTHCGFITVEDLWDLPLTGRAEQLSLDNIAKGLNKKVKESGEDSFVVKKSEVDAVLELKFNIVKRVIEAKLTEADNNEKKLMADARRKQILNIIADKKEDGLKNKSIEELQEELTKIG